MTIRSLGRIAAWVPGLLVAILLFMPGCGDDDPGDPAADTTQPSKNPILTLRLSYQEQEIDIFTDLLHPDFQTILLSDTCELWSWPLGATFDQAEITSIHNNMFSGLAGRDSYGNAMPPIDSLVVDLLEPMTDWAPIPEDDIYFVGIDGEWATYSVNIRFINTDFSHEYGVDQQVIFYVAPVTIDGHAGFQLLGIKELDMNPVLVYEKSARIVDARVIL